MPIISKDDVDKTLNLLYNRHTIASYRSALRLFVGVEIAKTAIQEVVSEWQNLSSSTIINRRAALKRLMAYLAADGRCSRDILDGVTFPKGAKKKQRRALAEGEVKRLMAVAQGERDLLLLSILLDTGLRAGTIPNIRWGDLFAEQFVVETKGGKFIEIYPTEDMALYGRAWMKEIGAKESNYVFTASDEAPISYKTLYRAFRRMADDAEVRGVTTHSTRHTFATNLSNSGTPITALAALMGHTNIETTAAYVHPDRTAMRQAVQNNSLSRRYDR